MDTKKLKTSDSFYEKLPVELQLMIFKYFQSKERKEFAFVSKTWAKNLQSFPEDYQLHLYDCYLRNDIEPVALLMNTTRKYRYLRLGDEVSSQSVEVTKEFLSHLGRNVQVLDICSSSAMKLLDDPKSLLLFPFLRKLSLTKVGDLGKFEEFPETLEHIHTQQSSVMEQTKDYEHLKKIRNLKVWTSDRTQLKGGLDALVQIASQFGMISTTIFTLDDALKNLLLSLQDLENIYLQFGKSLIGSPVMTVEDVTEIHLRIEPHVFDKFDKFPNLRSIHINWDPNTNVNQTCINFHQKTLCPKVEELKVNWIRKRTCMGCFRSLIDSFPNLQKFIAFHCNFNNEHVKHLCFKLPQLKHLEIESNRIDENILCNDQPEYLLTNLTHLEVINFSDSDIQEMFSIWPLMPNLRKVELGMIGEAIGLSNFIEKTPNLSFFAHGNGADLSNDSIEMIVRDWPKLHTLCFIADMEISDYACEAIKTHGQRLRTLEMALPRISFEMEYSFFVEIATLRKLVNDHRTMYREDFYNIGDYVRRCWIPYEELGAVKDLVDEYSLEDLENQD